MGLFGKLKEILFDEETVEIPVITKEEKKEEKSIAQNKESKNTKTKPLRSQNNMDDDEVIIRKIETPKRSEKSPDYITYSDDSFDEMPKLKETENTNTVEKSKKPKTFTFPVYEDDEPKEIKLESKPTRSQIQKEIELDDIDSKSEPSKRENTVVKKQQKPSGYTNAFDYSYGKYKGDYKSSRESNSTTLKNTLERKEERKAFSPSPIISPVYGVLNENYKKEDIVSKSEKGSNKNRVLDLDSVRRKAYGTLEDEIEVSLTKSIEEDEIEEFVEEPEILEEEGLSINDLLVDKNEVVEEPEIEEVGSDEFFERIEENIVRDEIELDEEDIPTPKDLDEQPIENEGKELEEELLEMGEEKTESKTPKTYSDEVLEEVKEEKTDDIKEAIGEEDLFDLIDSLYQGKGED